MLFIYFFCVIITTARIIQNRDPKIDPVFFDNVISQIVETSMDDMRYRLRQAIYSVAIKRSSGINSPINNNSSLSNTKLGDYEEWLLDQFINQISRRKVNDTPQLSEINPDEKENDKEKEFKISQRDSPISSSHTMSIALETFTNKPIKSDMNGLITSADETSPLFLNDAESDLQSPHSLKTPQGYLPSWLLLLTAGSIIILSILLLLTTIIICRRKRFKMETIAHRIPNPVHISSFGAPDRNNTPGSFIERMHDHRLIYTDRDCESVWGNTQALRTIS